MIGFLESESMTMRWRLSTILLLLCSTAYSQSGDRVSRQEFDRYKNEITREFNRQRTAYNEDIKILNEQTLALLENYRAHNEILSDLHSEVKTLKKLVGTSKPQDSTSKDRVLDKMRNLERRIKSETEARQIADGKIINEVSSLLERTLNRTPSRVTSSPSTKQTGKIYKVIKGDTLSAIAQAFGISLTRLKAVNSLQVDTIYIGQELNIPDTK